MTLTLENIHALSDTQLCEAISEKREPKPKKLDHPLVWDLTGLNWKVYAGMLTVCPIDWLLPENWTRLQEEKKINVFWNYEDNYWFSAVGDMDDVLAMNSKLSRAVCESWLYLNQEEK